MTRTDKAFERLREDILGGRWLPGTMLSTYALAEELEMSRTPVIDALKRLAAEELVEVVPQVGCKVLQRSSRDIAETITIRGVLEGLAAEAAATRITEHEVRALQAALRDGKDAARRGDATAYSEADQRFHSGIVRAAGNAQLEKLVTSTWLFNQPYMSEERVQFLATRMAASLKEHQAILAALESRDPEESRRLSEQHLRAAADEYEAFAAAAKSDTPHAASA